MIDQTTSPSRPATATSAVSPSSLRMLQTYRYPKPLTIEPTVDGYPNLMAITAAPGLKQIQLESGINRIANVDAPTHPRRPAILIRSSPLKAGSESTPWHDVFDLDEGHVRYFGDHKPDTEGPLGSTPGNSALQASFAAFAGKTPQERASAPPLLLFRAVRVGTAIKGYVQFCGLGVLERTERVVQWDPRTEKSFPNFVYDIAVLNLVDEDETFDWKWVTERRYPALSALEADRLAPMAWREWIGRGSPALPSLRRRVSRSRIMTNAEQRPDPGGPDSYALAKIHRAFDNRKHAFEAVASAVAARVLQSNGGTYLPGWLTRPSGDRGVDFVSRLEIGSGSAATRLVVLGQAKCVLPNSSISAEDVAQVVARLRRGWIGVYVTTGIYSKPAQEEIAADAYPLVLVHGRRLVEELRAMALESHAGDLDRLLDDLTSGDHAVVTHRRPEEILLL